MGALSKVLSPLATEWISNKAIKELCVHVAQLISSVLIEKSIIFIYKKSSEIRK